MSEKKTYITIGILVLLLLIGAFIVLKLLSFNNTAPPVPKINPSMPDTSSNANLFDKIVSLFDKEPHLIAQVSGSIYEGGENYSVFGSCRDAENMPITSNASLTIYYSNGTTFLNTTQMSIIEKGMFRYTNVTPENSSITSYAIKFNCTDGTDWAVIIGEFQVPNWVSRIKDIFSSNFKITSLSAVSPVYQSESVAIEAAFEYFEGNVDPDTINLTIYDPNSVVWTTAAKSDFTENAHNIWSYSKSVSANPTTGKYSAQLLASYNNEEVSKSVQFRIATGGPYKFEIEGPSILCLGSNNLITINVENEGEGDTETQVIIWLDETANSELDAAEPQFSFSKEVQGYTEFTETRNLYIPQSTPKNSFAVRGTASYVGSSQPDAVSSFTAVVADCSYGASETSLVTGLAGNMTYFETIVEITKIDYFWLWLLLILIAIILLYYTGFWRMLFEWTMIAFSYMGWYGTIGMIIIFIIALKLSGFI